MIVSTYGQANRPRLAWADLRPKDKKSLPMPENQLELCYALYNGMAWDLNMMAECDPAFMPRGWDGRVGDIVFRDMGDDTVTMGRIQR